MIEVYARRANTKAAQALVRQLQADGRNAREGNSAWFDPAQIDRSVVHVYHDGSDARIPAAYEPLGIPCELIPAFAPETAPLESATGHRVEQSGTWYKLIDPDGEQVGKSQRSEADAWALLEGD
jgi:hypothetical protein